MAFIKRTKFHAMWRIFLYLTFLTLMQILSVSSQISDPGGTPNIVTVYYNISEELPKDSYVGTLPILQGYLYHIQDQQNFFNLNENTGVITTKIVIDREKLTQNTQSFFVTGSPPVSSNSPQHPINVRVTILDKNDNSPTFPRPSETIQFYENIVGSTVALSTASDPDDGDNGRVSNYTIVGRDDENKFNVIYDPYQYGEVLIVRNVEKLDREQRSSYQINVSVQDNGKPPRYGYLQIYIQVQDVNDNPPIFDQSQYDATINESAPVGTLVIHVAASDNDIGVNAEITYSLSQDDNNQFEIDSKTGEIRTTKTPLHCLQRCDRAASTDVAACEPYSCVLVVTTVDGGTPSLTGRAYVAVKVIDENNHPPTISIRDYPNQTYPPYFTISENANVSTIVAIVTVTDDDPGTILSSVSIISGNEKGDFRMSSYSNLQYSIIQLAGALDRERVSKYNLTIQAKDSGNPPKSSYASLVIIVTDVNDHTPQFAKTEYRITLSETLPIGSYVESLTAHDEDSGENADLTYSVKSGNELGWFKLDDKTGLLTLNSAIHFDIASSLIMNVSVHDGGLEPRYNYTRVTIYILDENDRVPTFSSSTFNITLDENLAAGYEILMATATDKDSGLNGSVLYELHREVQLRYPNTFKINISNAKLTTQKILDREEISFYEIKIIAKDQGPQPLSSTATVNLKIADQNDNKPVFYPAKYYVNFNENQPIGSAVVQVSAYDIDYGDNAKITYSFDSSYPAFIINPDSGKITTKQVLTTNIQKKYTLTVVATDPDPSHISLIKGIVEVTVVTANDIAPTFQQSSYTFNINEDSGIVTNPVSKQVGSVMATASGKIVKYAIVDGDPENIFKIAESSGVVTSEKGVDREVKSQYFLSVVGYTDSRSTAVIVKINVLDVNDNAPKFYVVDNMVNIAENLPIGQEVYLCAAVDLDAGMNSVISYSLQPTTNIFEIDRNTGMISLVTSLQKQNMVNKSYQLTITATDGGTPQLSSTQQVTMVITDVNDHTPVFAHSAYEFSLHESVSVNEQFLILQAIDIDSGENARITYNITRGNGDLSFGIFPSGALYVAKQLDRETRDHYQLTVMATDNGAERRSSAVNVTVNIIDDNDNKPLFVNTTYTMNLKENSPPFSIVGSVSATDADIGRNAELSYFLNTGQDNFTIDSQTGEIKSIRSFDREQLFSDTKKTFYTIEVMTTDNGLVKLQDKATVNINILDENDNPPIFGQLVYRATLNENSAKYSPVPVKISASDADSDENQALTYSIISGNEDAQFDINSGNGQIILVGFVDRESQDRYVLTVLATDSGLTNRNSASCTVSITIADVNDNSPLFAQSVYEVVLSEYRVVGDEIIQFTATDIDLGLNAQIMYSVYGGDGCFVIDSNTGKLYLNKSLDYETKTEYKLNVSAADKGTPRILPTYATLTIKVTDENDNTPEFINTPNVASITENAKSFQSIMKVTAEDRDLGLNGQVMYSIINQEPVTNMFSIDPAQGKISFSGVDLDREKVSSYTITVCATDQALSNRRSAEKTIIINVIDENDNAPTFLSANSLRLKYPTNTGNFATVVAEDPDEGNNGRVTYTLLTQNSYFSLDGNYGTLSLTNSLPSSPGTYTLRVKASDNGATPKSKEMDVTVILVPTNGEGPNFASSAYSALIQENENPGRSLISINTSPNANESFYVSGITTTGKIGQLFQIGQMSGILSSSVGIDREVYGSQINVTVCAVQTSQMSPKAKCTEVVVTVQDLNDTPPKFSKNMYTISVSEGTPVGTKIASVTVTDPDILGQRNLIIRNGSDGKFIINSLGEISLSSRLDRETTQKHTLVIEASDGVQSSTASVVVNVADINDNPPIFVNTLYTFDVPEDTSVGTILGRVEASDPDEGSNGTVYYSLMETWGSELFALDLQKGTFTLRGNLDFEQVQLYTLSVQAIDGGSPALSSTVTVFMNIKDTNDNEPVFDPQSYSVEVKEDVAIGISVAMVSATDIDSGFNSMIYYEIFDGDFLGQFGVGRKNGTLFTRKTLDRETISNYTLILMAVDQAPPPSIRRSTTAEVTINIKDVNDNSPVFTTPSVMSVPEDRLINQVAFVVRAQDNDFGNNSVVVFSLTSNPSSPFRIKPTGEMLVNTALDREATPNYTVTVIAQDQGSPARSAVQLLTIKVSDINDNNPVFNPIIYEKSISENTIVGTTLITVTATDLDEGLNGNVRYYIVGGDDNFDFTIDQSSGVIRVQKLLDYERVQIYSLNIQAEDSGSTTRSASAVVTIKILDVNDNAPIFVNSPYYPLVQEEANSLPVPVLQVSARDEDSGDNNKVTYGFRGGDKVNGEVVFKMNNTSGEIICVKKLDREVMAEYQLIIVAFDSGIPSLTGTGTVVVRVQDINDHAPEFEHTSVYVGHIEEENQLGSTPILTVKATDADEGANAQIIYSLMDSYDGKFAIHPINGQLTAVKPLDREEKDTYQLMVIARDSALMPKQAVANITITVDDKNDNTPEFEKQSYQQTVNNPTQIGEFVLGVTALDKDIGANGQVVYSLTGSDKFIINNNTGILTASQKLSVAKETYTCVIKAVDQGVPRRSSSVNVTITVSDISSTNKPQFTNFPSPQSLEENKPTGFSVVTVQASSSGGVKYYIAGGNTGQSFTIGEATGQVTVLKPVDYEMTQTFDLWIEARDSTNMALSAFQKMVINIQDLNDNVPRFSQPLYMTSISEDAVIGATVKLQLLATDGDSGANGQILYRLSTVSSTFQINQNTGLITTKLSLDRETIDSYTLIVEAVDKGTPQQTGSTTVRITILDVNDNYPVFSQNFNIEIPEDLAIGSFIIQVTTSDADIGDNANVTYSIIENPGGKFKIDRYSGNITLLGTLDAEANGGPNQAMKIQISAYDNAHLTYGFVNVWILDVNDNTPQFTQPLSFSITERLPAGTSVGRVTATDADISAPNNQLYYSFKLSSSEFSIDSRGEIISKVEMVYIHNTAYPNINTRELVVIATDLGTPPRSSEAIVRIQITDANDHGPVFEVKDYYSAVPDNVLVGDYIMSVVAVDNLDYGVNAEVEYFKDGGSGQSYFYVNKLTGNISIASSLQGQQNRDLTLVVKAQDKGSPPRSVTQEVRFRITGINQYSPVFTTTNLQATIPENTLIGSSIASVSATDNDMSGPNGEVSYYIISGDAAGRFLIDKARGDISVRQPLDYETTKQHTLTIMARDQGFFFKNATVVFVIHVTDVNDNAPVFNSSNFYVSVKENTPKGVVITTISATDADSGSNAIIEYSFGYVETNDLFDLDRYTGSIKTKALLDYEQKTSYNVLIVAVNPGTQLKNTTQVVIEVTGVNEYYPKFVQYNYEYNVKESVAIGTVLGSVVATDQDAGEDGFVYYYLIGESNTKGFKIDYRSGQIIVTGRPDYESSPNIILTVMAKNWGSIKGGDTDECTVTIIVEDANDPPVFSQQLYTASVPENSGGNINVKQVSATDTDHKPADQIFSYTILDGNNAKLFKIDPATGWLSTTGLGILDRETQPVYNITVGAVDTGIVPQTGSAVVQITLTDINDNGPIFVPRNITGFIMENQQKEVSVINLQDFTTDPDLPPNQGPYKFILQGTSSYFQIDQFSGLVSSKAPIDREQFPQFEVGVIISDHGSPSQTSTLTFTVQVLDQNDNPPSKRDMEIQLALFEGKLPAGPFADVRPLDKDLIGDYTCQIETKPNIFYISTGCKLNVISQPVTPSTTITLSGKDGNQTHGQVTYDASINFVQFNNKTLDNTIIMKIGNILAENFIENKFNNMKQYMTGVFGSAPTVLIYSVKSVNTSSLVYLAVINPDGSPILHDILKQQVLNKKTDMEKVLGISVLDVSYSPCTTSTCNTGECLNRIDVNSNLNIIDSDHHIVSSPNLMVSYHCSCPPHLTGDQCEIPVNPCGSGHCQNGGFCTTDTNHNPVCDCPSSWTGAFCQNDVNECLKPPCQNGGTCQNTQGSFTCTCRDGFTGTLCENGSDRCSPNPCVNGECKNLVGGFSCKCPFTYWGDRCQYTSVGFSVGSFMEFNSLVVSTNDNTFDLTFATVKSRALLLYNSAESSDSNEFIALEIINGEVRFSFNLGDIQTTRLTVPKNVSTGDWFRVEVYRSGENAQLRVSSCPAGGTECPQCMLPSCVREGSQVSKKLDLGLQPVTIGGINDINVALQHPGQIESHDFVGCMRQFLINNEDYLRKTPNKGQGVDKNSCPRQQGQSACAGFVCNNGVCVDEWSTASCRCPPGYQGNHCQLEFKPFGFGPNSYVVFKQKESYQRDGLLTTSSRKRRALDISNIFIRFRTTKSEGLIFYAERGSRYSVLYVSNGALKYTIIDNASKSEDFVVVTHPSVSDGSWHNATVVITGLTVNLMFDQISSSKEKVQTAFKFSDVYVTKLSLGGTTSPVQVETGSKELQGFGGCISEFELDEIETPLNGTTDRFVIETSPGVENVCSGLCTSAGCQAGCSIDGEVAKCSQVSPDEPLGIGVIVVIAFFGVLLIVIVVIFFVYRCYRQRRDNASKQNGHVNKSFSNGHSPEDSGFGDQDDFIHRHVSQSIKQSSHYAVSNGRLASQPDLIYAESGRRSALPLEIDDGTVIIENGDIHLNANNEDSPELYDLENASSIAPSDIDVSYYYGASRNGKGPSYRNNYNKQNMLQKTNGHGPPSQHWNSNGSGDSPGALRMQTTAMQNRNSPANLLSTQHLNRNSPANQYGARLSPMNQLNRQSPHSRASPLVQTNVRGTPMSDIHHGRTDSDHSVVSHHSHHSISSTSSVSNVPPLPNGHLHSTGKRPTPPNRIPNNHSRQVKGLTVEEIDKLNARPSRPSPVSMLEAVSSSSEGNRRQKPFKIKDHLDDGAMLEPLDSSSDESANDSFTCSEFEYENEKGRNEFDPSAIIFSKLSEVDNETDELNLHHNFRNDGLDSNGSSFASSEEGRRNGAPMNGAINWDYFTDWGPSFEKLVGVFKDIASLPDGDENTNSNMDCRTETEEYV